MPSAAPIDLPVRAALPALLDALATGPNAVLIAPPGAGKTSLVAPALLDAPWLAGQRILLMLPRRLAARAAAERIAALLGEPVGQRVGYRTRLESRIGRDCRIECVTEGIFTNRIVAEPDLPGVGVLLFDEVHERSLEGDLGLALALDAQGALRPDLRLLAMSATIDGARLSALMGAAPVIESAGRQHPIAIHHIGRTAGGRIEDDMARAIHAGLAAETGAMLVFLPGVGEIARTAERLTLPPDVRLHKLHGGADPAAQRAALAPEADRKLVLATSIAETSLTIDGVRLVIDSGLARRPRFDRASGLTRLVTERASQAAATQRAGRAGRQAPGVVWRLWDEGETRGRIAFDPPEILEADLAPLLLTLAAWGERAPERLRWRDAPPPAAVAAAQAELQALGALDGDLALTDHGRRLSRLPLPPRLAHMLLAGAARGQADAAAAIALLLQERGLGGPATDIETRLQRFQGEQGPRAAAARQLARRWAESAQRLVPAAEESPLETAELLATAFPDRVARRRKSVVTSEPVAAFRMANGRGVAVDATDPLARAEWLVVADAGGAGADARVRLAAALSEAAIARWTAAHAAKTQQTGIDPATGRVVAEAVETLGAITVRRTRVAKPAPETIAAALLAEIRARGLSALPWTADAHALRARLAFAADHALPGLPASDDLALLATLEAWLAPHLAGRDRLADLDIHAALAAMLDWPTAQALDRFAPPRFATPAGTTHGIAYAAEGGPVAEVRVQALFGLATHPMLADGRVPLTLALTSPAGRPLALTRDLPAFWQAGWRDVQRDMRGRYPRHPWPDDPASATPTTRTKAADARRAG